jgi:hypothetical protein
MAQWLWVNIATSHPVQVPVHSMTPAASESMSGTSAGCTLVHALQNAPKHAIAHEPTTGSLPPSLSGKKLQGRAFRLGCSFDYSVYCNVFMQCSVLSVRDYSYGYLSGLAAPTLPGDLRTKLPASSASCILGA